MTTTVYNEDFADASYLNHDELAELNSRKKDPTFDSNAFIRKAMCLKREFVAKYMATKAAAA